MSRQKSSGVLFALGFMAVAAAFPPSVHAAQGLKDVLEQKGNELKGLGSYKQDLRFGRDRIDLALSPNIGGLGPAQKKSIGFSAQADLRMICGQYDLKATLRNLLGREAREEFLEGIMDMLVKEIVGSGMELLCQAEPTLCTLLQSYQVSAGMKMNYYSGLCQSIESAVVDAQRKTYASAVDQCLKDKQAQVLPLDKAMEACQKKSPTITGFRGEVLGELDLGRELHGLFEELGLSPGAMKLAGRVSDDSKLSASRKSANVDPNGVVAHFDELRDGYAQTLNDLLDKAVRREPVATVDLRNAAPPGAPPLAIDEVRALALLSTEERAAAVAAISSAQAIFEMGREIHEVERALEVLKDAPTVSEEKRKMLEERLVRLRNEKMRFTERLKDQALVMEAIGDARALATREYMKRVADIQSRTGEGARKDDLVNSINAYGALPQTSKRSAALCNTPDAAPNCPSGTTQFSFGVYGETK
jgi:hypothetical protein